MIVACYRPLPLNACMVYFDLVSILFGTSIPTSFNILVKMFLHFCIYVCMFICHQPTGQCACVPAQRANVAGLASSARCACPQMLCILLVMNQDRVSTDKTVYTVVWLCLFSSLLSNGPPGLFPLTLTLVHGKSEPRWFLLFICTIFNFSSCTCMA